MIDSVKKDIKSCIHSLIDCYHITLGLNSGFKSSVLASQLLDANDSLASFVELQNKLDHTEQMVWHLTASLPNVPFSLMFSTLN